MFLAELSGSFAFFGRQSVSATIEYRLLPKVLFEPCKD